LEGDVKKLMILALVLVTASLGFPVAGYAQTRTKTSLGTSPEKRSTRAAARSPISASSWFATAK